MYPTSCSICMIHTICLCEHVSYIMFYLHDSHYSPMWTCILHHVLFAWFTLFAYVNMYPTSCSICMIHTIRLCEHVSYIMFYLHDSHYSPMWTCILHHVVLIEFTLLHMWTCIPHHVVLIEFTLFAYVNMYPTSCCICRIHTIRLCEHCDCEYWRLLCVHQQHHWSLRQIQCCCSRCREPNPVSGETVRIVDVLRVYAITSKQ